MAGEGAVPLRDYPGDVVELVCEPCGRHGRYRKDALVERFGEAEGLPDVRAALTADCPRRGQSGGTGCAARFPTLARR